MCQSNNDEITLIPTGMVKVKKARTSVGEDVKKQEPSPTAGGCKMAQPLGKV